MTANSRESAVYFFRSTKYQINRMPLPISLDKNRSHIEKCLISRSATLAQLVGKTVVFVSPGYPGKKFVFEKAHELGINSIVIDSPGSWTRALEQAGIVTRVLEVDMTAAEDRMVEQCLDRLSQCGRIDGICTFVELSAPLTARLCNHYGAEGHSISAVTLARDKHLTRKAVSSTRSTAKYASRNFLIKMGTVAELMEAAEQVGFPAVLKPVSGAASLGVQKVSSMKELLSTYEIVRNLVSELVVSSGALERKVKMIDEVKSAIEDSSNCASLSNTAIILEEYISGQEVDIDVVMYEREITFAEVSDNGPTVEPYFGETYNCCPSLLPSHDQAELIEMARSIICDALGFNSGVFHIEGKLSPNGPRLIEVNCRMGGGPIRSVHLTRSKVDLVVEQILIAVGLPAFPPALPEDQKPAIGFVDVNASRSGSVKSLDFMKSFVNSPGMVYCIPYVSVGQHIVGPEEGQPSWLAEAVFTRNTPLEASKDAHAMYLEMQQVFEAHYV